MNPTSLIRRLCLGLLFVASGCQALGIAANALPKPPVKAKVILAEQRVGVMVWCDRGLRIDWPTIQKDLGNGVQVRLAEAQKAKAKELLNTTFPYPTESFIRWQRDHPGSDYEPITQVAPRLDVTRLIYIELEDLSTRASRTVSLFRGSATASVKVIECTKGNPVGKLIYEEHNIRVVYPRKSNEEGRPDGNDTKMYVGTMTFLADELAKRFVDHPAEDDE